MSGNWKVELDIQTFVTLGLLFLSTCKMLLKKHVLSRFHPQFISYEMKHLKAVKMWTHSAQLFKSSLKRFTMSILVSVDDFVKYIIPLSPFQVNIIFFFRTDTLSRVGDVSEVLVSIGTYLEEEGKSIRGGHVKRFWKEIWYRSFWKAAFCTYV